MTPEEILAEYGWVLVAQSRTDQTALYRSQQGNGRHCVELSPGGWVLGKFEGIRPLEFRELWRGESIQDLMYALQSEPQPRPKATRIQNFGPRW